MRRTLMRLRSLVTLVVLMLSACGAAGAPPARPETILPLRTLRLYETGVGYFERAGVVGARDTTLPVPAGHVDDALMTLVVLSPGGKASVQGLEFPSSVSKGMARALAGLPLDADTPIGYRDLLLSLKGARVTVDAASGRHTGRLVDVLAPEVAAEDAGEPPPAKPGKAKPDKADKEEKADAKRPRPELTLLVLTDKGEIRRFRASEVRAVQPTDPAHTARLRSALDALATRGVQTRRFLKVLADAHTPVTLGYVAETPIWRTTYRLVLDEKAAPERAGVLQGWALLHNDTDEDWKGVKVELVNGRPDSFLFPVAAPRYARRELVPPANALSTVPQLLDTTVDGLWGDHVEGRDATSALGGLVGNAIGEAYGVGGLGLRGTGRGGGGVGYGVGGASESGLLAVGNLASVAQASGVEAGALFSYRLAQPLSLRAHGSALVPFVAEPVEVKAITWVPKPSEPARAAVRLKNSTNQTLPAGPLAVFADGGFAGESAVDRLKPGERRFLQFGADLDLELAVKRSRSEEEPRRATFEHDRLSLHYVKRTDVTYEIENRGGRARAVFLALQLVKNSKVTGADAMDYDENAAQPVAVFNVPARRKVERALRTEEGLVRHLQLGQLTAAGLRDQAARATLSAATAAIIIEAAARQHELEQAREEIQKRQAAMAELQGDIGRLREHLRAAGGDKGAGARLLVDRILAAEDRLAALRRAGEAQEADLKHRQEMVRAVLLRLGS
jgi:hypothetical protein